MKKIVLLLVLSIIGSGVVLKSNAVLPQNERGYISVNTTTNSEVAPDIAEITFAIKTYDTKSMQKATVQNKEISEKVNTILKSMINPASGDYIKTSDYRANPIYVYKDNKRNFDKYEVSNKIKVHTKSIDKIGSMIDKSIDAGATNVDNLSFSASDYEKQCNELLSSTAQKAYVRANIIAKSLSTNLDGVRSFDSSCSANNYNMPRMYMAKNMLSSVADSVEASGLSTTISEGTIKINANVNATFFVK